MRYVSLGSSLSTLNYSQGKGYLMISQKLKCEEFASLHQQAGAFIISSPWDVGSAKLLQGFGFKALATIIAGLAHTLGRADGEVTLEEKLNHCSELAANTTVPINADFENGFADDPETIANNVLKAASTGIAGCSIEDFSRDSHSLYDISFPPTGDHVPAGRSPIL